MTRADADGFVEPAYGDRSLADVLPAVGARPRARPRPPTSRSGCELPAAPSYVVFLVDGLGAELLRRARPRRAVPLLAAGAGAHRHGRRAVDDRDQPDLARHRPRRPGAHGLVGFTARIPGTDRLLNHLAGTRASTRSSGSRTRRRSRRWRAPGCA